jgi:hypothetical protein
MCFYTKLVESSFTFTQYITCTQRSHETLSTAHGKGYQKVYAKTRMPKDIKED